MNEGFVARPSAAVLVLTRGEGPLQEVLLIERSATVKTHQSQVAFPGGGMEKVDGGDPAKTALRECFEEVGVSPHLVKIIKTFPAVPTLTSGFFVVPILGSIHLEILEDINLILDINEVAHAEWVPLKRLLISKGYEHGFPVFEWIAADQKKRKVWGLTAIILDLIFYSDLKTL